MIHLINNYLPDTQKIHGWVCWIIQPHFKMDIKRRIEVRADVNQFTRDDIGVWNQLRGKRAHYFELYWDGEWICDFTEQMEKGRIEYNFFKGFAEKYERGQVHLHTPEEYKKLHPEEKTLEEKINDAIKEQKEKEKQNKEDVMASDVVVEMLEERKDKVKKTKKKLSKIYGG